MAIQYASSENLYLHYYEHAGETRSTFIERPSYYPSIVSWK